MRTLLFCIAALSCFSTSGFYAQEQRHEFSYYFENHPQFVRRLEDGRTLLVCEAGTPYNLDKVYFVVLKADGTFDLQRLLNFPPTGSVPTYISDVQACPDSGFIFSIALGGCDYGPTDRSIQKFDKDCNYQWGKNGPALALPYRFIKDSDNNLIGLGELEVVKYDFRNGSVLWRRKLVVNSWIDINNIGFDPINNKMISTGFEVGVWTYQAGSQRYVLSRKFEPEIYMGHIRNIFPFEPEKWLAWAAEGIYTINTADSEVKAWKPNDGTIADLVMDGLKKAFVLTRQDSTARLLHINLSGIVLDTLWESTDSLKAFHHFWKNGDDLVLAGIRGAGDDRGLVSFFEYKDTFNSAGAYVLHKTIQTKPQTTTSDIALLSVRQNTLLDTTEYYLPYDTIYSSKGGNFDLLIRNIGNDTIYNFSAQSSFDWYGFICYVRGAQHKWFKGLKLPPGDSIWVNFGDISIHWQDTIYDKICFWTSSPNNRPDIYPENDLYCHNARYNNKPDFIQEQISIQPNPASEFLEIVGPGKPVSFRVFDYTGHLLLQDVIPAGAYNHRVNVSLWRAGMYYFAFDNQYRSFIIIH